MIELPVVNRCAADACAYNEDLNCHAPAITIGNSRHAECDTFIQAPMCGGDPRSLGQVGACKMAECRHNVDLTCRAPGINVGIQQDVVDCLTFQPA